MVVHRVQSKASPYDLYSVIVDHTISCGAKDKARHDRRVGSVKGPVPAPCPLRSGQHLSCSTLSAPSTVLSIGAKVDMAGGQQPPLDEIQWNAPALAQTMNGIHTNTGT